MTYPTALLIHSANLETGETLGDPDEFNVKKPTKVFTQISCRFGQPRARYPLDQSGDRVMRTPVCIVSTGTAVLPGKVLVGLTAPYDQTYRIQTVRPAMAGSSVSHLVLDLENVS
jgi:hypothetical protein